MSTVLNLTDDELRKGFYDLKTFDDLALLLDVHKGKLYYYAFKKNKKHYKEFFIPKKTGGSRKILAPSSPLKIIQKKLSQVLTAVYLPKSSVHGFLNQRSILTNAKRHLENSKGKRFVFNVDIKDFFPSITYRRVRGLLAAKPYNLPMQLAKTMANICCYDGVLPQGAPTSPIISNMICGKMDTQFRRLAQNTRCVYTRYVDDITFSTTLRSFPEGIGKVDEITGNMVVGDDLAGIITQNGFEINTKKVRLQSRNRRQEITGLTVNEFPNVPRKFVRQIRAMIHALEIYGPNDAKKEYLSKYANNKKSSDFIKVLRGKIEFLKMIRGETNLNYINFENKLKLLDPSYKKQNVTKLALQPKAVYVVTEGKSDWKHLKASLKRFHDSGEYLDLDIEFKEFNDDTPMGSAELTKRTIGYITERPNKLNINIFDRDEKDVVKNMSTDSGSNYKKWTDHLFSFVIPKPTFRSDPDVCLELYYLDNDIVRKDKSGRRLFITSEFDIKSQRHRTENINCTDKNKFKLNKLTIVDKDVYNGNNDSVALSKNDFAEYILANVDGFKDLDISEFRLIFNMIRKIVKKNPLESIAKSNSLNVFDRFRRFALDFYHHFLPPN